MKIVLHTNISPTIQEINLTFTLHSAHLQPSTLCHSPLHPFPHLSASLCRVRCPESVTHIINPHKTCSHVPHAFLLKNKLYLNGSSTKQVLSQTKPNETTCFLKMVEGVLDALKTSKYVVIF